MAMLPSEEAPVRASGAWPADLQSNAPRAARVASSMDGAVELGSEAGGAEGPSAGERAAAEALRTEQKMREKEEKVKEFRRKLNERLARSHKGKDAKHKVDEEEERRQQKLEWEKKQEERRQRRLQREKARVEERKPAAASGTGAKGAKSTKGAQERTRPVKRAPATQSKVVSSRISSGRARNTTPAAVSLTGAKSIHEGIQLAKVAMESGRQQLIKAV